MLRKVAGFSLLEVVLVLLLSSVMLLSITAWLPELIKHHLTVYQRYRLDNIFNQVVAKIAKDLQRAGFIFQGKVIGDAVSFQASGQGSSACLIIYYDLDSNGKIDRGTTAESELFGYRLQQGAIEQGRGRADCQGSGWEKITDKNEIEVTHFQLVTHHLTKNSPLFEIQLTGHWLNNQSIVQTKISFVKARNQ